MPEYPGVETKKMTTETIRTFRFQKLHKHVLSSIADSTLHFASPATLNDPYDCQIDLPAALGRAVSKSKGRREALLKQILEMDFIARAQSDILNFGVCCFSLNLENGLMWSHYADSHRGICLYYDFSTDFIQTSAMVGWAPVTYGENPLSDWLAEEMDDTLAPPAAVVEIVTRALRAKSKMWEYEVEGRMIRTASGLIDIPRECLKGICFGLETPEADKRLVRGVASPHYKALEYAQIVRNPDADTGLRAIELR